MTTLDDKRILRPAPHTGTFIEVRGSDGRLYGRFCPEQQLLEVRKGRQVEVIDLKALKGQG
jgi:hypothetical protein